MAINTINVGNIPNDGTGDDLREAFIKVNDNFDEVSNKLAQVPLSAANRGQSGEGIFAQTVDNVLEFKKLSPGQNITLTSNNDVVIIDSAGGLTDFLVLTDSGSLTVDGSQAWTIGGGDNVTTRTSSGQLIIDVDSNGILSLDSTPALSASLQANNNDIQNAGTVSADLFVGPLVGTVDGYTVGDFAKYFDNYWDFGGLLDRTNYTSILQLITRDYDIDLGGLIGAGVVQNLTIDLSPDSSFQSP
jgi:hypothetical protein